MTSARAICGIHEIFRYKSPPVPVLLQPVRFSATMMLRASAGRPGVPGARVPAPPTAATAAERRMEFDKVLEGQRVAVTHDTWTTRAGEEQ